MSPRDTGAAERMLAVGHVHRLESAVLTGDVGSLGLMGIKATMMDTRL